MTITGSTSIVSHSHMFAQFQFEARWPNILKHYHIPNHWQIDCLFKSLFRKRTKKASELPSFTSTGHSSTVAPSQWPVRASNAESVSMSPWNSSFCCPSEMQQFKLAAPGLDFKLLYGCMYHMGLWWVIPGVLNMFWTFIFTLIFRQFIQHKGHFTWMD